MRAALRRVHGSLAKAVTSMDEVTVWRGVAGGGGGGGGGASGGNGCVSGDGVMFLLLLLFLLIQPQWLTGHKIPSYYYSSSFSSPCYNRTG